MANQFNNDNGIINEDALSKKTKRREKKKKPKMKVSGKSVLILKKIIDKKGVGK